ARRDRGRLADARRACQDGAVVVADRRRAPALRGVPPRAGRRSGDEPALAPAGGRRRADRPLRRARWRARLRNGGDGGGQDDGRHLPNDDRGARGGLRGAWAVAAGARRRCAGHRGVRLVGPGWGPRAWPDWRARTAPGGPEAPTRLADRRRAGAAAAARARRGPGHDRDGVGLWDGRELGGPRRGRHRADRRPGRADDRAGLPGRGAAGAAGAARGGGGRCRGGPDVGRRTFGGRRRGGDSIPRVSAGGAGGTGGGEPGTGEALEASVVIPAHNAAGTLHRCLTALREEGVPGRRAELIVVDDGSSDDTAAIACSYGARVLASGGRGPAAARNLGARAARGAVLVFLDADTAPKRGWLSEMLAPLDDPCVVGVKGRYDTDQHGLVARFSQLEFEEKYARLERAAQVDFVDTGTAAFRRGAFLDVGGFDESFPASSAEDVELAFRLAARGARFAFNPSAVVLHRHSESLLDYLRKKLRYGYFRVRVYQRHPDKALGDSYTPRTMAVQIGLAGFVGLAA